MPITKRDKIQIFDQNLNFLFHLNKYLFCLRIFFLIWSHFQNSSLIDLGMFYFKKESKLVKKCRLAFKIKLILEVTILLSISIQPIRIPNFTKYSIISICYHQPIRPMESSLIHLYRVIGLNKGWSPTGNYSSKLRRKKLINQ